MQAGVALAPATPPEAIRYVLPRLDQILVMTVNPGFAGQPLVPEAVAKIADLAAFLKRHGHAIPIAVDGNVSFEPIPGMVAAGARILACGSSSLFHAGTPIAENAAHIRDAIGEGLARGRTAPAAA